MSEQVQAMDIGLYLALLPRHASVWVNVEVSENLWDLACISTSTSNDERWA